jgi:hypothetical protein
MSVESRALFQACFTRDKRIAELEDIEKCAATMVIERDTTIRALQAKSEKQDATITELRERVEELESDGNCTAAEALTEWWSQANVQGTAEMSGEEMQELVLSFAPPQEKGNE